MSTHSFRTALTLYRSGTLSLAQAARQAGCSETAMASALGARTRSRRARIDDADASDRRLLVDV
ncbi:UPF0175 family protein [Haloplanus halophilus]|uniref:UPF0175 family protein n=1 Tax=Haloplanus halophilus TaxID=2949993 RepID=UPI00203C11F0|nr:UPF0175 family protein [Haloplanus sp. GDY1]